MAPTGLLAMAIVGAVAATEPVTRPAEKYVVVFDFAARPAGAFGAELADSVRLRLARHGEYKVVDRLTTSGAAPAGGVSLETPDKTVLALMRDRLGAHVALFGSVQKVGSVYRAEIRCLDLAAPEPAAWTSVFSDEGERARAEIARQVVETIRGRAEWTPPQYGDEPEPEKFDKPLNVNGGFDAGPAGWQRCDNVSSFLVDDPRATSAGTVGPAKKGKVLRLYTDLDREAWLKYQHDLRLGQADPDKPPAIGTVANKYATVAGLEGVHFRSDWIAARPGWRYWLVADVKGKTAGIFFPKIFVKGFADFAAQADGLSEVSLKDLNMTPEDFARLPAERRAELVAEDARKHPERYRREVYRWYLPCRNEGGAWKHFAAPFPPRGGLPANVQFLRIEVYAYWPPGEYLFDDVHLYLDPRLKAPVPEEPPRTPGTRDAPRP